MKVLLILCDGMRPDSITAIPQAQAIISRAASTMRAQTVIPPVTLPCHMSLFHSVDPARHGTTTNIYMPQSRPIDGLCEVLFKNGKHCAFFHGWEELRDLARPGSLMFSYYCSGRPIGREKMNNNVTDAAMEYIQKNQPDFAFLYLGYTDWAGHQYGWLSDGYMAAIRNTWENIERVVASLPEEYTVFITADHGGHERMHGEPIPEDMTIPLIALGRDFPAGSKIENANIKDIAPTIAKLLDMPPCREWEGKSLV